MAIRGVLFDKDGTLLDFQGTWVPLYRDASMLIAGNEQKYANQMLEASGFDKHTKQVLPDTVLAQGTNIEIAEIWHGFTADKNMTVDRIAAEIGNVFSARITTYATQVTDLRKLFLSLKKRGLKLGVATSDGIESAKKSLEPFDILNELDFIAGFDSGFGIKPSPGMIEGFAKKTNLSPTEIMMVGDSPHDMEMGRAAKVGTNVGVLTGASTRDHLINTADHIIDNISTLESLLHE